MSIARLILISLCLSGSVSPLQAIAQDGQQAEPIARGEYVTRIAGCRHCHTAEDGTPFAGGRPLETPFGTFYTPNITADESAGIGAWNETDFLRALGQGVAPDGSHFYPAFPYTSYTRMTAGDARAIYAYLRLQPTSDQVNREHDIAWYLQWRFAAQVWQWLFFTPGEFTPDRERSAAWNRGAYIAQALGHCSECHTPRNLFGAPKSDLAYAGNPDGPDGELVPNITSDRETGIGDWSRESLELFLRFGELPDGEYTTGSMGEVIRGIGKLTDQDRAALIEYLRALPPIRNSVGQ